MHACEMASALDVGTVIVPRHAGVLSALGMLLADVKKDYSLSVLRRTDDVDVEKIERSFLTLVERGLRDLRGEGFDGARAVIERSLDVRYVGQSYEITVPFTAEYRADFDRRHARWYGYASPQRPTEIVNLRVKAIGVTSKPSLPASPVNDATDAVPANVRSAYFGGRQHQTGFYRRDLLAPGAIGTGPAVLTSAEATTVVPPGFRFRIDGYGNLIAEHPRH